MNSSMYIEKKSDNWQYEFVTQVEDSVVPDKSSAYNMIDNVANKIITSEKEISEQVLNKMCYWIRESYAYEEPRIFELCDLNKYKDEYWKNELLLHFINRNHNNEEWKIRIIAEYY